jgi:hypothetical protein
MSFRAGKSGFIADSGYLPLRPHTPIMAQCSAAAISCSGQAVRRSGMATIALVDDDENIVESLKVFF